MSEFLESLIVIVRPEETITTAIKRIADADTKFFGICLVIDEQRILRGVFNSGDVLRLIASGADLKQPITHAMVSDPVVVPEGLSENRILDLVRTKLGQRTGGRKSFTRYIPVVDSNNVVLDVLDLYEVLARLPKQGDQVAVYGLGFVGLTLAAVLASRGHSVTGIDVNTALVAKLQDGHPHVYEPRLQDLMRLGFSTGTLSFRTDPDDRHNSVVIIAVGTPLNEQGVASMVALEQVCQSVGSRLRRGDIVMLRSTVPVGTTRTLVVPLLESISGLTCGKEFHVAFCPERTVEGKAIQELSSLPQIVGGATNACVEKASAFWVGVTDTIVRVDSLEASELVKLINNSYRDISFAFANGLTSLADNYNIDATRLIAAANEGYPRNPIPVPSPGVGGYCLTKDPFLYASVNPELGHAALSRLGRKVNEEAGRYPVTVLETFAYGTKRKVESLRVLLVGMAFKGNPETNDLRGSISVSIARELMQRGCNVECFDAVIGEQELRNHGLNPARMSEALSNSDAVLILNNHEKNIPIKFLQSVGSGRAVLVFDGWSMLERHEAEKYPGVIYANLGYMTKTDSDVIPLYSTKF